ncbi:PEP-CTERM sorting domain-containing protein [Haloferula sp. A504]|uniref:PEP-CTERM sorting domain-containing protein n=1 Tax=Haloferula sp. A504 TaxID=3373601 RepID=UPI0031BC9DFC|nr:PEP-CTERM sorting domain-containing protein [Verrucomicrobiaceae bacterium E54]
MKLASTELLTLAAILFSGSLHAAVTFTVTESVPDGANGSGTRALSTTLGDISAPANLLTTTYTISNLDLTSVGGTLTDTIAFDITYSQTGGTGVQFNGFGNVSVRGDSGDDNQIDVGETLTAAVSLNAGLTTFGGVIGLGLVNADVGGLGPSEEWNVIHDGGTIGRTGIAERLTSFASSSFVTIQPVQSNTGNDAMNLQGFDVVINAAVPEPSSLALVSGFVGLSLLRRRR